MGNAWIKSAGDSVDAENSGGNGSDTVKLDLGHVQDLGDSTETRSVGFSIPWIDKTFSFGSPFGGERNNTVSTVRTENTDEYDEVNGSGVSFSLAESRRFLKEIAWNAKPESGNFNPTFYVDFIHDLTDEPDSYTVTIDSVESTYTAGATKQLEIRLQVTEVG